MAGSRSKQILKAQALQALAETRHSLHEGVHQAREKFSPKSIAENAVRKHGLFLLGTAVIGGFVLSKTVFSRRKQNSRDTSTKSATKKRTIAGILLTSAWGLAREPLMALAAQRLMPLALQYIDKLQSKSAQTPPPYQPDSLE